MTDFRIPVARGGEIVTWALVDEADFEETRAYHWYAGGGYAIRGDKGGGAVSMHRQIAGCTRNDGREVHHRNENHYDNRRANLMVCKDAAEHSRQPHPTAALATLVGVYRYAHQQRQRAAA